MISFLRQSIRFYPFLNKNIRLKYALKGILLYEIMQYHIRKAGWYKGYKYRKGEGEKEIEREGDLEGERDRERRR